MKNQTGISGEHTIVAQQLNNICRALPWCQGLSWRFSDLQDDALPDLYAALEGLSTRFCEILGRGTSSQVRSSRTLGVSLAKYLYDHPDRCQETLNALGLSVSGGGNTPCLSQ